MNACGLSQIVQESTHRGGHTLDHIYANQYEMEFQHEVIRETFGLVTDHLPIKLEIPSPSPHNKTQVISYRKLKDINLEQFKEDLKNAYETMNITNLNFKESYSKYHEVSQKILDNHSPIQTREVRDNEAAWIDKEYSENRARHRKLERIWKKNRTEDDRNNYINQKQCVRKWL